MFVVLTVGVLTRTPVWAKDCGGAVTCDCGDVVIADYTLPADLGPCSGNGLDVTGGVTLDGAGHIISGRNTRDTFGVSFRGQGATVHDVRVTKFARCVRFRSVGAPVTNNVLRDSETSECGFFTGTPPTPATSGSYGVDMADGAVGNLLENNHIGSSFDEGIHLGGGSQSTQIINNTIENATREQVYILTSNNTVMGNTISGGQLAVFVDGGHFNLVTDNVTDRLLQARAGASNNEFLRNTSRSVRFEMDATNNLLADSLIKDGFLCIQFRTGATGNVLDNVELENCVFDVDARETGTNTLIGVTNLRLDQIIIQNHASVIVCDAGPSNCREFITPRDFAKLTSARVWVGLADSNDQGARFDLRVELYNQGLLLAAGERRCAPGITGDPANAKAVALPFRAFAGATINQTGNLSLKVLTRVGTAGGGKKCGGVNAPERTAGLILYYDAVDQAMGFGAQLAPLPLTTYFAHTTSEDFLDALPPTAATPKQKVSAVLDFAGGNPWQELGTWNLVIDATTP